MKKGITIAGNMLVDYVKIVDTYPKAGMLCNISDISKSVGGCVPNTLIDIAGIDPTVPLFSLGAVGADENGRYIKQELERSGISIEGVITKKGTVTSFTDVMGASDTKERTFFHARGANVDFSYEDIDQEQIKTDMFHMGYALLLDCFDREEEEYQTVMSRLFHELQERGIKTSMDVVSEEGERFIRVVRPCLKYCNYFIANEIEGGRTADITPRNEDGIIILEHMEKICRAILKMGVRDLVVLHAPEGCYAMTSDGNFYQMPSLKLPKGYMKGSVGAGDAFCAGILYGLYREMEMEKVLIMGNVAAACNLSAADSVSGRKSIIQMMELYEKYK